MEICTGASWSSVCLSYHGTPPWGPAGYIVGVGVGVLGASGKEFPDCPSFLQKIKAPLLCAHPAPGTALGHLLDSSILREEGICSEIISRGPGHLGQGLASLGTNNQTNLATTKGRADRLG